MRIQFVDILWCDELRYSPCIAMDLGVDRGEYLLGELNTFTLHRFVGEAGYRFLAEHDRQPGLLSQQQQRVVERPGGNVDVDGRPSAASLYKRRSSDQCGKNAATRSD